MTESKLEKLAEQLRKTMSKRYWGEDYSEAIYVRNGYLKFSTEYGLCGADYYSMKGYAVISETLENFAEKLGMHWEWENPAIITMYK